jgi:hypothetical protein
MPRPYATRHRYLEEPSADERPHAAVELDIARRVALGDAVQAIGERHEPALVAVAVRARRDERERVHPRAAQVAERGLGELLGPGAARERRDGALEHGVGVESEREDDLRRWRGAREGCSRVISPRQNNDE